MKSNIQVSVIIPVYNAGHYLETCLDSVCAQAVRGLEIICIDDGSTDDSYTILKRYAQRDDRIRIISQVNSGPGSARNRGLREAMGEFVAFLDADDYYLDGSALGQLYRFCKENHVNVCGSALKYLRQGVVTDDTTLADVKKAAQVKRILQYSAFQFDYGYTGFLFSREMLEAEQITFPTYRRYQDPCFLVRAMYAAGQFSFCDAALYVCRVPTMASRFTKEKVTDLLMGLRDNLSFAREKRMDKLFETSLMRLEYEYYSIICRYVSIEDARQISLLREINCLVCEVLNDDEYLVRPLSCILSKDRDFYLHYEENLCGKIMARAYLYLYGAGGMARKFIRYLKDNVLLHKVKGIIVSEQTKDGQFVEGIPVGTLERLQVKTDDYILIGTGAVFHKEIYDNLQSKGFGNADILDSVFLEELPEADG